MSIEERLERLERSTHRYRLATMGLGVFIVAMFFVSAGEAEKNVHDLTVDTLYANKVVIGPDPILKGGGRIVATADDKACSLTMTHWTRENDSVMVDAMCLIGAFDGHALASLVAPTQKTPFDLEKISDLMKIGEGWHFDARTRSTSLMGNRNDQATIFFSSLPQGGLNFGVSDTNGRNVLTVPR